MAKISGETKAMKFSRVIWQCGLWFSLLGFSIGVAFLISFTAFFLLFVVPRAGFF